MIKLIATDVDGTLVKDGTLAINPQYYNVISRLIEKGIVFVVCSGRQFISQQKLFAPIKNQLYYITDGGTVIRDYQKILKVYRLEESIWRGMYASMEKLPSCDCFVCLPEYSVAENAGSAMFHWLRDSYGYDIREIDSLANLTDDDVIKFTVYHKNACEEMCSPEFIPTWKDKAKLAVAGKEWVDCISKEANKGTAIRWLQNYLGISPDETCVFGDNLNDIELLSSARYSFAVSNAREEVIRAASGTVAPYWEDGVLNYLKTLL